MLHLVPSSCSARIAYLGLTGMLLFIEQVNAYLWITAGGGERAKPSLTHQLVPRLLLYLSC